MIGKIKGTLTELTNTVGYVELPSGLSYLVYIPPSLLSASLPREIELYTYLHVREDALILFGFETKKEHDLFCDLLSISGVGPKLAYTIICTAKEDELIRAIQRQDIEYLTAIPGLGKKTAMKIILDLAQKLKQDVDLKAMNISEEEQTILDALVSLGFETSKARGVLRKISPDLALEEKIKEAIRLLSQ